MFLDCPLQSVLFSEDAERMNLFEDRLSSHAPSGTEEQPMNRDSTIRPTFWLPPIPKAKTDGTGRAPRPNAGPRSPGTHAGRPTPPITRTMH